MLNHIIDIWKYISAWAYSGIFVVFGWVLMKLLKWINPSFSLASISNNFNFFNFFAQKKSKQSEWAEQALNLVEEYEREMQFWLQYMYAANLYEHCTKLRAINEGVYAKAKSFVTRLNDKDILLPLFEELEVFSRALPSALKTTERTNFPIKLVENAYIKLDDAPEFIKNRIDKIRKQLIKISDN